MSPDHGALAQGRGGGLGWTLLLLLNVALASCALEDIPYLAPPSSFSYYIGGIELSHNFSVNTDPGFKGYQILYRIFPTETAAIEAQSKLGAISTSTTQSPDIAYNTVRNTLLFLPLQFTTSPANFLPENILPVDQVDWGKNVTFFLETTTWTCVRSYGTSDLNLSVHRYSIDKPLAAASLEPGSDGDFAGTQTVTKAYMVLCAVAISQDPNNPLLPFYSLPSVFIGEGTNYLVLQ